MEGFVPALLGVWDRYLCGANINWHADLRSPTHPLLLQGTHALHQSTSEHCLQNKAAGSRYAVFFISDLLPKYT